MKSFKEFVSEAIAYKKDRASGPFPAKWRYTDNIDGHQVEVEFTHEKDQEPWAKNYQPYKHYNDYHEASYSIGKNYSRRTGLPKKTKHKILKYVHNTIIQHIDRTKPKAIRFIGNTERKTEFYGKYVPLLARQVKGTHREGRINRWKKNNTPVTGEHFLILRGPNK